MDFTPTGIAMDFDKIFELSTSIRYVALYLDGKLLAKQRKDLIDASSSESDRYEELLVNPILLKLAKQRGDIDCGGARYVIVGYGNFHQLVIDHPMGHISICFEPGENPISFVDQIVSLV
ncbi:Roadblock/LAMTOR2 domain-containing protein [Methylorubrum thiocyanatum]